MSRLEDSVVISGIGGKFPESDNVLQLQEKLFAKEDLITDELRWTPDTVGVGKIHDIDSFDSSPFKMHSKLVRATDPTTTQTLERAFEAIIDAGMNPFAMSGRNIAVISASMVSDSENTRAGTSYEASGFTIMGHNRSMVSNRISYTFNFTGPSYSIHTSWAGGARALELGAELIERGFVEAAVVSTASLIFFKATALEYEYMNMATPGGRCRSFDANANGTCRSEGVVSFFLQRASEAKRNYATVVSAKADCLGPRASSLIHFDSLLAESLQNFYKTNNIDPEDIAYLEADGSGIKYFDKLELDSLSSVFGKRKKPLPIGSVKSNVGNTEASSSFIGITKSIIAMETGLIPPNINYSIPNPDIASLVNGQFQPVTEAQKLEGDLVSINTLSLGGTSGHVVIRRNSKEKRVLAKGELPPDGIHRLIMMSARHEEGAKINSEKLQNMPVDVEYASLVNDVFKTNIPGYLWKSFVVVPSNEVKHNIKKYDNVKQPLWYVFSGMGSQWPGMGKDLLDIPVFAAAVAKCDAVLRPRGVDIYHILTTDDVSVFENILNCFIGIAAIQIGLVDILRTIGLEPDGMVGHSVGELGCAYADGCFTAEEMVLAAYARGKASLECDVIHGMMAAVGLGYQEMRERLPPTIDVACHNAQDSCTLSGPTEDVLSYVKQLKEQNIFAKAVSAGNIAYHSRYIKPVAPKLLEYLSELITEPKPRSKKWISSSVPQSEWSSEAAQVSSAEYHTNNLLSPVLFEEACSHLPQNAVVVEIAPHGLLQAILRRSLNSGCVSVPLTNRSASNGVRQLLEALGTLYLNNVSLEVNALYPPVEYPVSRGTPYIAPLVTWDHHETWFREFENILELMSHSNEEEVNLDGSFEDYSLWTNHCIDDKIVLSPSQVLVYIWKMQMTSSGFEFEKDAILIEDMIMSRQVTLQPFSQKLVMTLRNGTNDFGVLLKEKDVYGETFLTGRVKQIQRPTLDLPTDREEEDEDRDDMDISGAEVISVLSNFGYQLGPKFQSIKHICIKTKGFTAKVEWTGDMVTFIDALFKLILFLEMDSEQRFLYPSSFRTLIVDSATFFELKKGTSLDIHYDSRSNILSCQGLMLVGLKMSPDPTFHSTVTPLQWKKATFVPFNCEKLKMEEFLSVSLQLVAEEGLNSWKPKPLQIVILQIRDNNGTRSLLRRDLKNTVKNLPHIFTKIQDIELSQAMDQFKFKPGESYLVIGNLTCVQQLVNSVQSSVFLLAHNHRSEVLTNGVSTLRPVLVHHLKGGDRLTLLKKKTNVEQLRILELNNKHWLSELGHLFNGSDNGQPVVVVSRKWEPKEILPILANQNYSHRVRCVFLDKSAPHFSPNCPLYHDQLSVGLSVCKLYRGVWGTDSTLTLDLTPAHHPEHMQGVITSSDTKLDVNVLALNTTTVTFQPDNPPDQITIEFVDYCGTWDSGERVMGLAHFNPLTNSLTPDRSLIWPVPQVWSMEEAATVASSFSLAYYSLHIKAKLLPGERVLIQVGSCPVSQACIAVALLIGADVFVTIQNKDELPFLLRTFPQLNADHIVPLEHFNTTVRLKTGGNGVEVVVNCLQDTEKSISCLSYESSFIQLCNIDFRHRETIGMGAFIKNSNFYGVSLTNVLNADSDTKNKLHIFLRDGIKKGIVKPLRKQSFKLQNFSQAMDHVKNYSCKEKTLIVIKAEGRSELPLTSLLGFHCEADKTHIIVGTGGLWLELAEWLVQRGARRLFVAPVTELSPTFSRRFHRLTSLCYVRVMVTSATRLVSHSGAADFLRSAETLGPISTVFCVAMDENCPKIAYLDSATRELVPHLKHFVCLLGGCTNVCKFRAQSNLSVCLIQSQFELQKPHSILPYLSYVLCDSNPAGHLFTVSDQEITAPQDDYDLVEEDSICLLPSSMEELLLLADDVGTELSLREVVTRSPCHESVKHNLLPVFLLPGTHAAHIQPLIRHMIHPAYCVSWPETSQSVESIASALLEEVLRVQQEGPYNVVGDSWSGGVAIQLAALLEGRGHRVELFLLNAGLLTMQNCARALSCNFNDSLDLALLTILLNLDTQLVKNIVESSSWEELLHQALQMVQPRLQQLDPTEEVHSIQQRIGKALKALRSHIKALMSYKPQENLFKGSVHLIRPKGASDIDFCGIQQYCQQRPTVYVMEEEENHDQMIKSFNCATIINKNLLYSWDL